MDENPEPRSEPSPASAPPATDPDLLASLLQRVSHLERQVAALQSSSPLPRRAAPPPRPLPAPLQRLAEGPPPASAPSKPTQSLENRLGSQVFNRIGIVALLLGAAWALKLAVEQGWLGPVARILVGLAAGVGIVLWSERFRRNGFPAFSYSLKAVGTGVLYLSLWAAFQLYHLLPASIALTAMILVTAWNAFMAWSQDAELLAAYALTGAFATPLLLSTGGNHEIFLFTYILAIDVATLLLVRLKPWPRLLMATLAGTVSFFIGWYSKFYPEIHANNPGYGYQNPDQPFALTVAFTLAFFAIFLLPSVRGFLKHAVPTTRRFYSLILDVLLPLGNAAFGSLAMYSLFQDSLRHDLLPWLMVGFAAVYLGLMRVQRTALSAALHLAFAIIFLTIAIPLKASGHTLTIAWLVEGLVLLWASTRVPAQQPNTPDILTSASVLRCLSFVGYTLGFFALFDTRYWFYKYAANSFFNADLASALVGIAVFAGAAYLGLKPVLAGRDPIYWLPVAWSDFLAIDAIAILLAITEIAANNWMHERHHPFGNTPFFNALLGMVILAATTYTIARITQHHRLTDLKPLAAITFVLFNLATILVVEREIGALWPRYGANLQRSLAISGFLMVYGAALLTAGFLKRNAFTRWQALVLLLFTILKVFLYDMSSLAQGYRVASFLALGALLMAVSFAYQKDWLALKNPAPTEEIPEPPTHA
jgi:uncharacterized membrane protein